jgi:hypothetical protein
MHPDSCGGNSTKEGAESMNNRSKKARKHFDLAFEKLKAAAVKLYGEDSLFQLEMEIDQWHECAEDEGWSPE